MDRLVDRRPVVSPQDHEYIRVIIYIYFGNGKFKSVSIFILCNIFFSLSFFVMKTIISFLCKHSSILICSIIDVERDSNYSLNVIISLGPITCFILLLECYTS